MHSDSIRLSTVTLPDNPPGTPQVYSYAYNGTTGKRDTLTAPDGGTLAFTYDGSLLLGTSWEGAGASVTGNVTRTYDNDFRITSRSVNGANTISFGFDGDGLLTSAGSETLAYDLTNGLMTGTALGVVTDSYSYSGFGEVGNYTAQVSAVDQFATTYVRDKLGRITQKTENVQGVAHTFDYTYNAAGYLVEVQRDSVIQSTYTYDLNGNRLNSSAVYDDQDRLTATNSATYTYTDNGELLTKTEGALVTQYTYDVLGNLLSVTLPSGTLIEYIIDASNRRIGKKVDGVLQTAWLYKDGLNPIAELEWDAPTTSWNLTARFVYASRGNVPDYVVKGGVTYRIISDHLGSPRLVINSADGTVIEAIEYDDWGNVLSDTNPGFLPFAFAGGLYDADTKLIRFGARDYDPATGRWTAKDPIGFAGGDTSLFGYALNDPINKIDLNGLLTLLITTQDADGTGTHSAIYVDNSGDPLIYDPAGSYDVKDKFGGSVRGTGDVFEGGFVKLEDYLNFHLKQGDKVAVVVLQTDDETEKKIANAILGQPSTPGGLCANSSGHVLGKGFPDLGTYLFPNSLLDDVKGLPDASVVEFNEVIK